MATTTTNYGFDVPQSSDLVKNGATQIALLGQDLDTFLFRPFTRNVVLNSSMQIFQRGISTTITTTSYVADRWQAYRSGGGATATRQVTGDTTNLPNIQYCLRIARDNANASTNTIELAQSIETINSIPFAGKTVTFSFYARKGADYSPTSGNLLVLLAQGTGTDQNVISGFTGNSYIVNQSQALTATWTRYTYTATVGTTATQLATYFTMSPTGTAGAADYFEITGVQLEVGSQASPYCTATGTFQGELAACQRYYYRVTPPTGSYHRYGAAQCTSTTSASVIIPYAVTMRTAPTALEQSGTAGNYSVTDASGGVQVCTAIPAFSLATQYAGLVTFTAASLVAGNASQAMGTISTNNYLGWSAEL